MHAIFQNLNVAPPAQVAPVAPELNLQYLYGGHGGENSGNGGSGNSGSGNSGSKGGFLTGMMKAIFQEQYGLPVVPVAQPGYPYGAPVIVF